jgi:hypothetical protein
MPTRGPLSGYKLGDWEIDLLYREVRERGVAIDLDGRAFEILVVLVPRRPALQPAHGPLCLRWPDQWRMLRVAAEPGM